MVVVSIAFIGLLGSIVLSATMKNIEMKAVERKHKENFYLAEAALNEIKAGISEIAREEIAKSYASVLKEYSMKNPAQRRKMFTSKITEGIKRELHVSIMDKVPILSLTQLLKETKLDGSGNGGSLKEDPEFDILADGTGIAIRNIAVIYVLDGYSTGVTTDIVIEYPVTLFESTEGPRETMVFKSFALIANESLHVENTIHKITGNLYSGPLGMKVGNENTSLEIKGDRIISAGDIEVSEKAVLKIDSKDGEIWARNIATAQQDKRLEKEKETSIFMNGKIYVEDDLTLDAKRSLVELKGEYYGYSNGDTPEKSSAIMINGSNASLKLEGLTSLSLAGRAFVSLNSSHISYDPDESLGAGASSNTNMPTGESLAVKGSQYSYLVPDNFIDVGHNPVSWREYEAYYTTGKDMVTIDLTSSFFNYSSISSEEEKLGYYLNETEPYKKAFYKFGSDNNVVYYYLNFKSLNHATTFSKHFRLCYPERVYQGFPIEVIEVNDSAGALLTAGNLYTYSDDIKVIYGNNGDYISSYKNHFTNLSSTLQKNQIWNKTVFEYLIDVNKLKDEAIGKTGNKALSVDNSDYFIDIVDNKSNGSTYILDNSGKKGLIIATGNVEVRESFEGLIIAGGKVTMMSHSNLTENQNLIYNILMDRDDVREFFTEFKTLEEEHSGTITGIDLSQLVYYENWKKN